MTHPSDPRPPQRNSIYRWIRALMLADIAAGIGLILFGLLAPMPEVVGVGVGLALIGAALFLFFRRIARTAAERPPASGPGR